jgi:hypothetical protein
MVMGPATVKPNGNGPDPKSVDLISDAFYIGNPSGIGTGSRSAA